MLCLQAVKLVLQGCMAEFPPCKPCHMYMLPVLLQSSNDNQVLPMCLQAVESVLSGRVQRAFAVVRPPGHHAECTRAMGFCFFNSAAASALVAHRRLGARQVLVLDWDVHHGELNPAQPPQMGTALRTVVHLCHPWVLRGSRAMPGLEWDVQQGLHPFR